MRERLKKEGWEYSTKHSVDPSSMQDINESFTKVVDGKRFVYLPEDDWKIIYTHKTPTNEDPYWRISENVETIDDIYKFIEKYKDVK